MRGVGRRNLAGSHGLVHVSAKVLLPVDVLAKVFRGKFADALKDAFVRRELEFHASFKPLGRPRVFAPLIRQTFCKKWVVYSNRPFGGPQHALRCVSRYTHRVAISHHRLGSAHLLTFK
jgi:hypothetical protein